MTWLWFAHLHTHTSDTGINDLIFNILSLSPPQLGLPSVEEKQWWRRGFLLRIRDYRKQTNLMLLLFEYFSLSFTSCRCYQSKFLVELVKRYFWCIKLILIGEINAFPKCKGVLSLMFCAKLMNEFLVSVDMLTSFNLTQHRPGDDGDDASSQVLWPQN